MSLVIAAVIAKAALAGSGCKAQDKVEAHFSDDGGELAIELPAFTTTMRANCEVVLTIDHAAGVQMLPKSMEFRWNGALGPGGSADLTFKYHYQGKQPTPSGHLEVKDAGKVAARDDVVAVDQPVASECGKTTTLVLGIAALVRGQGSVVEVTKASPVKVDWQACK